MYKILRLIILSLLTLFVSCKTADEKFFHDVNGEWQITRFYHNGNDLTLEDYSIIGFEGADELWMNRRDENRESKFVYSRFKVYGHLDTLRMNITKCDDKRFEGTYDVYLNTVEDTGEQYIIRLVLDNKNAYLQAIRSRNKYMMPKE